MAQNVSLQAGEKRLFSLHRNGVIEELKKIYPKSPIGIAGDDDSWKEKNTGKIAAEEAAQKICLFPCVSNI
jgi:hypothetical protein